MQEELNKKIVRAMILSVVCLVGGYIGILFLINSDGSVPLLLLGCLLSGGSEVNSRAECQQQNERGDAGAARLCSLSAHPLF